MKTTPEMRKKERKFTKKRVHDQSNEAYKWILSDLMLLEGGNLSSLNQASNEQLRILNRVAKKLNYLRSVSLQVLDKRYCQSKGMEHISFQPCTVHNLYMDMTDWCHELGRALGGNKVYPSLQDLSNHRSCIKECGIVEVSVSITKVVNNPEVGEE